MHITLVFHFFSQVWLRLPQAPPCFTDVIVLKDAAIGWRTSEQAPQEGAQPLLSNLDLTIKKKQRVLVLGPNGGWARVHAVCACVQCGIEV